MHESSALDNASSTTTIEETSSVSSSASLSIQNQKDKEELVKLIREYVKDDNEIRELKKRIGAISKKNKKRTDDLMNIMRTNNVECFDINDGSLVYKKVTMKRPMSIKYVSAIVNEFFKNDVENANNLNVFIDSKRDNITRERIVRKINKIGGGGGVLPPS